MTSSDLEKYLMIGSIT